MIQVKKIPFKTLVVCCAQQCHLVAMIPNVKIPQLVIGILIAYCHNPPSIQPRDHLTERPAVFFPHIDLKRFLSHSSTSARRLICSHNLVPS